MADEYRVVSVASGEAIGHYCDRAQAELEANQMQFFTLADYRVECREFGQEQWLPVQ